MSVWDPMGHQGLPYSSKDIFWIIVPSSNLGLSCTFEKSEGCCGQQVHEAKGAVAAPKGHLISHASHRNCDLKRQILTPALCVRK